MNQEYKRIRQLEDRNLKLWRITARETLPERMQGLFTFKDAYLLCCEWNKTKPVERMAQPEISDENP